MSLYYDDRSKIVNSSGSDYRASKRFRVVLDSLPDKQVPKSLILIGVLTEEVTPVTGDSSRQRDIARSITNPPRAEVPEETVKRILWVLSEVRDTLPADRKETIGRILSRSGLNSPSIKNEDTTDPPEPTEQATSPETNQSTTTNQDTSETSDDQSTSAGEYECEFCGDRFHTDRDLMSHLPSCPDKPAGVQFSCDQCSKTYHSQHALDKHLTRSHERKTTAKTKHRCSDYTATFDSATALLEHRTTHSDSSSQDSTENPQQTQPTHSPNKVFIAEDDVGFVTNYKPEDGYGFISTSEVADDVFFHRNDVTGPTPAENDYLQYDIKETDRGYKAINITHKERTEQSDDPFASTRTQWGGQ
ncbi:cold shock domain-containing protein [Halorubrum sp. RMP-47]|uniref:cold shock domain-containing protein n=1 Tax=Halorubrum miltondacostae TaxID=3076378 RepID=UPI003528E0EA